MLAKCSQKVNQQVVIYTTNFWPIANIGKYCQRYNEFTTVWNKEDNYYLSEDRNFTIDKQPVDAYRTNQ
mgnify:FL=1